MRTRAIAIAVFISAALLLLYNLLPSSPSTLTHVSSTPDALPASPDLLHASPIMPHLGNATAKAVLGRSTWHLLHTTLSRYSTAPSTSDREALSSFIYLLARVYPCGECAQHFQAMLQKYPPQTSSREAASQWGCFVHNVVNERLGKEEFDCKNVLEHYKCGCAEEGEEGAKKEGEAKKEEEEDELRRNVEKAGRRVTVEDREGVSVGG